MAGAMHFADHVRFFRRLHALFVVEVALAPGLFEESFQAIVTLWILGMGEFEAILKCTLLEDFKVHGLRGGDGG